MVSELSDLVVEATDDVSLPIAFFSLTQNHLNVWKSSVFVNFKYFQLDDGCCILVM